MWWGNIHTAIVKNYHKLFKIYFSWWVNCCWYKRKSVEDIIAIIKVKFAFGMTSTLQQQLGLHQQGWKYLLMHFRQQSYLKIENFEITKFQSSLSGLTRLLSLHSDLFFSGFARTLLRQLGHIEVPPHCLRIQKETKRKLTQPTQNIQSSICSLSWYGQEECREITG